MSSLVALDQPQSLSPQKKSQKAANPNLCEICYVREKRNGIYFATCRHTGSCMKCAEDQLKAAINEKRTPKCFMDPECGAKIASSGDKCWLSYFSAQTKQAWANFTKGIKNPEDFGSKQKHCEKPDCSGIVTQRRCSKCLTHYCEICQRPSHGIDQKCRRPNSLKIAGLKECPHCRQPYTRTEGCHHVTCPTCQFEFCQKCEVKWDMSHKLCLLSRDSIELNLRDTNFGDNLNNSTRPILKKKVSSTGLCCGLDCAIF